MFRHNARAIQYSNFEIPARVNTNYEISNVKKQINVFISNEYKIRLLKLFILYENLINYFYSTHDWCKGVSV